MWCFINLAIISVNNNRRNAIFVVNDLTSPKYLKLIPLRCIKLMTSVKLSSGGCMIEFVANTEPKSGERPSPLDFQSFVNSSSIDLANVGTNLSSRRFVASTMSWLCLSLFSRKKPEKLSGHNATGLPFINSGLNSKYKKLPWTLQEAHISRRRPRVEV